MADIELDDHRIVPAMIQSFIDKFRKANGTTIPRYTKESMDWFRKRISKDMNPSRTSILRQHGEYKNKPPKNTSSIIGRLYYFNYAAEDEGKKGLGVYDAYPAVFFFSGKKINGVDHLWGINMHYLKPADRAKFLIKLMTLKSSKKFTEKTKLNLTWKMIKALSQAEAEECVHQYRADRFLSTMVEIDPREWEIFTFLNLQQWKVAPNSSKPEMSQSYYRKHIGKLKKVKE